MEKISLANKYLLPASKKAFKTKEFFNIFLDKGLDFFSGKLRNNKVLIYKSPRDLRKILSGSIPKNPIKKSKLIEILNLIGKFSIGQSDKKYLAFPDTGNSKYAIGGAIYSRFLTKKKSLSFKMGS